jgi:hypothetical protein
MDASRLCERIAYAALLEIHARCVDADSDDEDIAFAGLLAGLLVDACGWAHGDPAGIDEMVAAAEHPALRSWLADTLAAFGRTDLAAELGAHATAPPAAPGRHLHLVPVAAL